VEGNETPGANAKELRFVPPLVEVESLCPDLPVDETGNAKVRPNFLDSRGVPI
jgi:hypothetical protein